MGRGPKWNEATIERFQAEGRGKGHGPDYKPWLEVADLSSRGKSHRVLGLKTGREHHLFSNVEWDLFLLLEWSADVIDIREQFPLDRKATLAIAAELGIRHPYYPRTNVATVVTVDMMVTRNRDGERVLEAFDAKRTEEAEDARSLEKLQIARRFLEVASIPHRLVFHSEIPQIEARNIAWIRGGALRPNEAEPHAGFYQQQQDLLAAALQSHSGTGPLSDFCSFHDRQYGVPAGTALRVAQQLLLDRRLIADLSSPDLASAPMASFRVAGRRGALRAVGGR